MQNDIFIKKTESTQTESKKTFKSNIKSIKIPRGYFIGESEKSILMNVNKNDTKFEVWIPKKFIKISDFTLVASVGFIEDYEYNTSDENVKILGSVLISLLKK